MAAEGGGQQGKAELMLMSFVVLLGVTVASPVVLRMLEGIDLVYGPNWVWFLAYGGALVTYVATSVLTESSRRAAVLVLFLVHELLALTSVLLLRDGLGVVAVVLVFGAALSCYVLPCWGTAITVAVNTVAIAIASMQGDVAEALVSASFYLMIQIVSVVTVSIWNAQVEAQKKLSAAHVELAATSALLERSAKTEERLRISRDLHDVVGHQLTALTLELEIASHQTQPPADAHVLRARGMAKDLLSDVRDAVSEQRDEVSPLSVALRHVTESISTPVIRTEVDEEISVGPETTTALVRAAQEVVTNTIRHAYGVRTLQITVREAIAQRTIVFQADDDGTSRGEITEGNGLRGMRERAEALGGTAHFTRNEAGGMSVRIEVPR